MAQEDATALIQQLSTDQGLQSSIKSAATDAMLAEAKKAGFDVTTGEIKTAVSGAQKGGVSISIPIFGDASAWWD